MIYCVTLPLTRYGFVSEGEKIGLFYSYPDRHLFNLITRCSRIPFMYEQGSSVPMLERIGIINGIEAFEQSLKPLRRLLEDKDPLEMAEILVRQDLDHLPLAEYWQGQDNLKFILQARAYQWLRYQGSGNTIRMAPRKLDEIKEAMVSAANTYV